MNARLLLAMATVLVTGQYAAAVNKKPSSAGVDCQKSLGPIQDALAQAKATKSAFRTFLTKLDGRFNELAGIGLSKTENGYALEVLLAGNDKDLLALIPEAFDGFTVNKSYDVDVKALSLPAQPKETSGTDLRNIKSRFYDTIRRVDAKLAAELVVGAVRTDTGFSLDVRIPSALAEKIKLIPTEFEGLAVSRSVISGTIQAQ